MGYRGAVVTPHIHSDIYPNNRLTLMPACSCSSGRSAGRNSLQLAAEYFLDEHFADCIAATTSCISMPLTNSVNR